MYSIVVNPDDMVIFAKSEEELSKTLAIFSQHFCDKWKLQIKKKK